MATEGTGQPDVATRGAVRRLIEGYWATHVVGLAARLGIADHLADGPRSADELAELVGANPPALARLLRALQGLGLIAGDPDGRFALTAAGSCLREGVPGSLRAAAIFNASEYIQRAWTGLEHSIRTGEAAFDYVHGVSNWQYRAEHPDDERVFNRFMTQASEGEIAAILAAYDILPHRRVIDLGGGRGHLLAAILRANPAASGVLFDLPSVIEDARPYLEAQAVLPRCELAGGSFFDAVPGGGDLYTLKSVLNSFPDEPCGKLLAACRRAMDPRATLLLIEHVMPSGPDVPAEALADVALRDMAMLVMQAGRQRTEGEFRALLDHAGFALQGVLPAGAFSILVANPA
jgi:O-methyltransferase domain/Dimerisation domain